MTVDESRSVPTRLARGVEALEPDQPRVVRSDDLARIATEVGIETDGTKLAYELRQLGWLTGLRTRDAWGVRTSGTRWSIRGR